MAGGARKRDQSKELECKAWLDRINDLIRNSRTIWFALNGALVFAIVTLFSVEDIAFFDPTQRTRLPLLGIEVPVVWFFIAGSPLIAATYVYLHLYLTQLWQALGDAPATVNDRKLCDAIHPWIVSDTVLRVRDRLRGGTGNEESSRPRGMGFFAGPSTMFLVWLSGPLTTCYFWWRSMPAHDLLLTCWLAAMAVITASAGYQSASIAATSLSRPGATAPWIKFFSGSESRVVAFAFLAAIVFFTVIRTTASLTSFSGTKFFGLAQANLRGVNLSEKPQDWLPRNLAKAEFRSRWCRENEIETCINELSTSNGAFLRSPVGGVSEDEELFEVEWRTQRTSQLASLRKTTLRGKDLRGADIVRASLEGVDLSLARLELADLSRSNLEGANLKKASLRGAFLRGTLLEGMNLQSVKLQGANLTGARLEDVDIAEANLEATRLISAFVSGSPDRPIDFSRASLRGSIWRNAALRWSTLSAVEMAELLYFETTFGDASVSLPTGFPIPCQWADNILSDAEFFGRWRGWIEATSPRPSVEFLNYRSIPPPAGCGPNKRKEPAHSDDQDIDVDDDD